MFLEKHEKFGRKLISSRVESKVPLKKLINSFAKRLKIEQKN